MGHVLAICGWMAWQTRRLFDGTRLSGASTMLAPIASPSCSSCSPPFPCCCRSSTHSREDVAVQQIFDGTVSHPDGWVRLQRPHLPVAGIAHRRGRHLRTPHRRGEPPARRRRRERGRARAAGQRDHHRHPPRARGGELSRRLPIEATVAGTPPRRRRPDRRARRCRQAGAATVVPWPLAILPILLAAMLLIGARVGYPIFRPAADIDVLASPLAPGERLPSAYGGRIGPNEASLGRAGRRRSCWSVAGRRATCSPPSRWQTAAVRRRRRSRSAGAGRAARSARCRPCGRRAGAPRAIRAGGRHVPLCPACRTRPRRRPGRRRARLTV